MYMCIDTRHTLNVYILQSGHSLTHKASQPRVLQPCQQERNFKFDHKVVYTQKHTRSISRPYFPFQNQAHTFPSIYSHFYDLPPLPSLSPLPPSVTLPLLLTLHLHLPLSLSLSFSPLSLSLPLHIFISLATLGTAAVTISCYVLLHNRSPTATTSGSSIEPQLLPPH